MRCRNQVYSFELESPVKVPTSDPKWSLTSVSPNEQAKNRVGAYIGYGFPQASVYPESLSWTFSASGAKVTSVAKDASTGEIELKYKCDELYFDTLTRSEVTLKIDPRLNFAVTQFRATMDSEVDSGIVICNTKYEPTVVGDWAKPISFRYEAFDIADTELKSPMMVITGNYKNWQENVDVGSVFHLSDAH